MIKSLTNSFGKDGEHVAEIFSGFPNKVEAELFGNKLNRSSAHTDKMIIIVEVEAPLKPNIVNGKQVGWYAEDSVYQVASINRLNESQEYVDVVFMLGFKSKAEDEAKVQGESLARLIGELSCFKHLSISFVNQRYFIMQALPGFFISELDAKKVLSFNKAEYGASCRDISVGNYVDMFQSQGLLIIGLL